MVKLSVTFVELEHFFDVLFFQCPLFVAPRFDDYTLPTTAVNLGLSGEVQRVNAALAVQAAELWKLRSRGRGLDEVSKWSCVHALSTDVADSLSRCWLPGRAQLLRSDDVTFCIDGAHTGASVNACVSWFENVVDQHCDASR
jgi:folylpolyglutamate synthase